MDGVEDNPAEGRLLAGLNRNVFPAEGRCADESITRQVVRDFHADTLAKGVVGGAAYMTVHAPATCIALEQLPDQWHVGLVLMNQNCPEYLRTDEGALERDIRSLQARFARRLIVTDRFAVAVGSDLRRRASRLSQEMGLRMQTHLNEQIREKELVERTLYPHLPDYAHVYEYDELLPHEPILAHCIHMHEEEWELLADWESVVAHCPVSNTLLGSGVMDLDRLTSHAVDYAIATDVGASLTTSLLVEMTQFLRVHQGRSTRATPSEALYRTTRAPARILQLESQVGRLELGRPMSFIEVQSDSPLTSTTSADNAILRGLLDWREPEPEFWTARDRLATGMLDAGPELDSLTRDLEQTRLRLEDKVMRITLAGQVAWERGESSVSMTR
jgi:guanine deaminase